MVYGKLRKLRVSKKISTREMAEKIGISKAFYSQLENGKRRLSYETAIKIAAVFNVKPDCLFYDDMVNDMKNVD